jgi:hypothetical protein
MYKNSTHTHHTLKNRATAALRRLYTLQEHYLQAVEFEVHKQVGKIDNGIAFISTCYQSNVSTQHISDDGKIFFSMTHSLSCSAVALHCKSRIALEPQEGHTHSVLLQNPTAHRFSFRFCFFFWVFDVFLHRYILRLGQT